MVHFSCPYLLAGREFALEPRAESAAARSKLRARSMMFLERLLDLVGEGFTQTWIVVTKR